MPETPAPSRSFRAVAIPAIAFALLTLPLLIAGKSGHSEMKDAEIYHRPVVEAFAEQLPTPDLTGYDSATAPGYHLLMAIVHAATGGSSLAMTAATWLFGLGLVCVVAFFASRVTTAWRAALLTLPLACSSYTIGGATALSTDNVAVMFAAFAVGSAIFLPWNAKTAALGSVASLLAVAVRQIFVWTIAPIGFMGLLASPLARSMPALLVKRDEPKTWTNLALGIAAAALPVILLGIFVLMWGGLVPATDNPEITKHQNGLNPATFAYGLALLGIFAPPFAILAGARPADLRCKAVWLFVAIAIALALAVPTSHQMKARAYGWFWQILVMKAPDIADRSAVILALAPVGAASCALLWLAAARAGRARQALVLALTALGWLVAQSLNSMAWQKYFEQILLLALAWITALALSAPEKTPPRLRWAALYLLIAFQALFGAAKFYKQAFLDN